MVVFLFTQFHRATKKRQPAAIFSPFFLPPPLKKFPPHSQFFLLYSSQPSGCSGTRSRAPFWEDPPPPPPRRITPARRSAAPHLPVAPPDYPDLPTVSFLHFAVFAKKCPKILGKKISPCPPLGGTGERFRGY